MDASEVIKKARNEIREEQARVKNELVKQALCVVDRCSADLKKATESLEELASKDVSAFGRNIEPMPYQTITVGEGTSDIYWKH